MGSYSPDQDAGRVREESRVTSIRRRIAVGTVTCLVLLSSALMTSAPGLAAPRPKPKPTPTATATPVPSPTSSPSPTSTPTSSPTPTPSPTASPTPAPICQSTTTYGTVAYCLTTLTAIATGKHPVGASVAVPGSLVLEVLGASQVILGRNDCPPDMYCGQTLATLSADFSQVLPAPPLDSGVDVYGTVTPDFSLLVTAYTRLAL